MGILSEHGTRSNLFRFMTARPCECVRPCRSQWFAKAKRQAQLALSRAKSAGYKPLEDPKYALTTAEEEDDDEDDE